MAASFAQELCIHQIDQHATVIGLLDHFGCDAVVFALVHLLNVFVHGQCLAACCLANYTRYQCVGGDVFRRERHSEAGTVCVARDFFDAQLHDDVFWRSPGRLHAANTSKLQQTQANFFFQLSQIIFFSKLGDAQFATQQCKPLRFHVVHFFIFKNNFF